MALGAMPFVAGQPRITARASEAVAAVHSCTGAEAALGNGATAPRAAQGRRPRGRWRPHRGGGIPTPMEAVAVAGWGLGLAPPFSRAE